MSLTRLEVYQLRNLAPLQLKFDPNLNIISGANASGKTSLLEAIYLLGQAKSFRTRRINVLIQHGQPLLQVIGYYQDNNTQAHIIGIERSRRETCIHINKQTIKKSSKLASLLPVQIITPESHYLLDMGPKYRRQFIDWGVFHVKHPFLDDWKAYHQVLRQRNAALRQQQTERQVRSWDQPLIAAGQKIHQQRSHYLENLIPVIEDYTQRLTHQPIKVSYQPGWDLKLDYSTTIQTGLANDQRFKHTRTGPHRADLLMTVAGQPVQVGFSRGQQKLLVCAMRLAQVKYLHAQTGQNCVVMVDDLPAELDTEHRAKLLELLKQTQAQIFVTTTEASQLQQVGWASQKLFHVEHGAVKEVI